MNSTIFSYLTTFIFVKLLNLHNTKYKCSNIGPKNIYKQQRIVL